MRISNGLGLVMPGITARIEHGKVKETILIGLDTGIPHEYASVNTGYAKRIGLSATNPKLEKMVIETATGPCVFKDLPVGIDPTVGSQFDIRPLKIYLGAPIIDKMGGRIAFVDGAFNILCGGENSTLNLVPGTVGVLIGLVGTWILLKWFFK